jgi:hypothetical protein
MTYYLSEQETKYVAVYNIFIYEFNKRIDDIKVHEEIIDFCMHAKIKIK